MSKSKVLGSTLIIAGTTIGAGMLALPLASAGIGFSTSLTIMAGLWALMAYTALIMVELHQHASSDATLHTLAKQILGTKGKYLASFAMLFLFYSLCAAYIAGGGSQFNQRLDQWFDLELSAASGTVIFTLLVASIVVIGTATVDKVNRVLFTLKLISMATVLLFLAPNVTQTYLLSMPIQQGLIIAAIPVIFTSFGFHGSIPAIVRYLDGDTPALRKAIVIGSAIPLVIYIFWQLVTLGVVSQDELIDNQGLSALISTLAATVQQNNISHAIGLFADLALLTSFLGVSLGLFEFLGDSINKEKSSRVLTGFITFTPPMCFALFYPQGFIMALGYAAIALAILAIFLPIVMIHKVRRTVHDAPYQVRGGNLGLVICSGIGVMIVSAQILITMGFLPALG
ncbi:tyrosine-specific transport protein [Vibrio ichthyoenteri ATCC 700023]|uniref:Aromatic amino acid permease n=1 Tax=Vibrio ichthyoenteri ATCC 700023 TaxID=870968 RepID=F9S657_9VIBR|nr:aromatic amino acid transport family protein [Vibrio ichthyoenteri]EGU33895.1 tyrosine-specific transport protein [Vibrio ichthyoenteri ATCC 700023]